MIAVVLCIVPGMTDENLNKNPNSAKKKPGTGPKSIFS